MSTLIQNILWCIAGIAGVLLVIKLVKSRQEPPAIPPTSKTRETIAVEIPNNVNKKESVETAGKSAKEAFLDNVDNFCQILPQLNGSLNIEAWTEQIVGINNPMLTSLWRHCLNNVAVWKQMLSSWGLRQDSCKSFTYLDKYANMYETADNSNPEDGCRYRVIDGCWILTDDQTGEKRVIKKGIIEKL